MSIYFLNFAMLSKVDRCFTTLLIILNLAIAGINAEIQCYACNSYLSQCGQKVDNSRGTLFRSRCAGRCFARQGEDNAIYRGCFDGFDDVPTLIDSYVGCRNQTWNNRQLLWCLCDTNLCNGDDLHAISRAYPPLPPPTPQVMHPGRGTAFRPMPPPPPKFAGPYVQTAHHRTESSNHPHRSAERDSAAEASDKGEQQIATSASAVASRKMTSNRNVGKSALVQSQGLDYQESTTRQKITEPIYYLPETLLQRGPYIWTPDERPPYIVERVTDEHQNQKALPTDDYFLENANDNENEHGFSNGRIGNDDVTQYDDHPHNGADTMSEEAHAVDVRNGQTWWASSIENIVNNGKHSRYDGSAEWNTAYVDDVKNDDVKPMSPTNEADSRSRWQYRDMSPSSQDFRSRNENLVIDRNDDHAITNDQIKHNMQDRFDHPNDLAGSQRSNPEVKDYRPFDEEVDYGKYMQRMADTDQSTGSKMLNDYVTKSDNQIGDSEEDKRTSVMDQARCTSDAGYHLHPEDCRLYYVCIIHHNGLVPIVMRCPTGLLWDDRVKLCVVSSTTCRQQSDAASSAGNNPNGDNARYNQRESDASSARDQRELEFIYRW